MRRVRQVRLRERVERFVERGRGRRRHHELAVVAVDLTRRRLIAAIEARHRDEREPASGGEMIQQLERAIALARAGAYADRELAVAGDAELGRERDGRKVMPDRAAALLGELDERVERDLVAVGDLFELQAHRG